MTIHYRPMYPHEAEAVCHLVARVFCEFVAPHYGPEGVAEFLQYLTPAELWKRLHHDHFLLVAEDHGKLAGVIEIYDNNHISLLFVDKPHHGQGIARTLLNLALAECRRRNPALDEVSVHATPNAVPIYAHLGFQPIAPEQCKQGMRFVPMLLSLHEHPERTREFRKEPQDIRSSLLPNAVTANRKRRVVLNHRAGYIT
jgi:GNAT superfamily N-acetyltransferase